MKAPKQIAIADQEIDLEKAIADALERVLAPVAASTLVSVFN